MKLPHETTEPRALASGGLRTCRRPSFTLVELLVVIAIIGVLASMLLAAVFKVLDVAYEAQTRTDIAQLSVAIQAFRVQYNGVDYIPSRIVLCKAYTNYFVPGSNNTQFISQLHQESLQYLTQLWPRMVNQVPGQTPSTWGTIHPPQPPANVPWIGVDWSGDGQPPPAPGSNLDPILEGEQCLVFFLGGIPSYFSGTTTGFSTNGNDPSWHINPNNPNRPGDIVPPFFEFKSNRLVHFSQLVPAMAGINDFYVYLDGYGKTPYAYFSSYHTMNGYNRYWAVQFPYSPNNPAMPVSDCSALQVWPYALSGIYFWGNPPPQSMPPPVYENAQTYQIISAGKNYTFGTGTVFVQPTPQGNMLGYIGNPQSGYSVWTPSTAAAIYPQGQTGYDDISNFYDRLLGVATQ